MHFLLSAKRSCFLSQRPKTSPCPSGGTCLFTSGTEITPDPCRHSPPAQRQRIHLRTAEQAAGELHKGFPGGLARQEATGQPPTGCSWGSPQPPPWHPPPLQVAACRTQQPRTFPRRHSISQSAAANQSCACATQSQRCSQEEAETWGGCGGKVGLAVSPPAGAAARCVCVGSRFQPLPGVSRIPPRFPWVGKGVGKPWCFPASVVSKSTVSRCRRGCLRWDVLRDESPPGRLIARRDLSEFAAAGSRPRCLPGTCLSRFASSGPEVSPPRPTRESPQVPAVCGDPLLKAAPVWGSSWQSFSVETPDMVPPSGGSSSWM